SIKQAAEGGELAEEYREHFEVDEHGNWTAGDTDAEREAAWSEYYGEDGPPVEGAEGAAAADVVEEPAPLENGGNVIQGLENLQTAPEPESDPVAAE
ncbi:MAG: hypothetical protein ABW219_17430, partial [Ilumatobacteraceae bacterium]